MHDFRGNVSDETHVVLEAVRRVTGRTHQDIARDVLHQWAVDRLHEATLMHRLAKAEGIPTEASGGERK
jgi:hypothetical protein